MLGRAKVSLYQLLLSQLLIQGVFVARAGELQLVTGVALKKGAATLDVGTYAIPCVADWNGDSLNAITNVAHTNLPSCGRTTSCTNCASRPAQFYRVQIVE